MLKKGIDQASRPIKLSREEKNMKPSTNTIQKRLPFSIVSTKLTSLLMLLLFIQGVSLAQQLGPCDQLTVFDRESSKCHCTGGAGYVQSCGTGISTRIYDVCYGGFKQGYQLCINKRQKIGTRWDCVPSASWSKIVVCAAQAAACSVACASSATHAGILCAACLAHYLADCTGCGFYTCSKRNETDEKIKIRTVASGVCDVIGNTGR
jgi:hypothetical protein